MFVEGLFLHNSIVVTVFSTEAPFNIFCAIGWGKCPHIVRTLNGKSEDNSCTENIIRGVAKKDTSQDIHVCGGIRSLGGVYYMYIDRSLNFKCQ
jgi:hypothetical protein